MLLSAYLKYKARSVAMMQTSCKCWTVSNWRFCRLWKILTFCKRAKKKKNVGLVIALNSGALALCVLTNLFCHQCLAVFKMVPFQDGGSMKLRQRRCAPTLEMDCEQNVFLGSLENISSNIYTKITLSGRDCWYPCGQYRDRMQPLPSQRHRGLCSIFSAFRSVRQANNIQYFDLFNGKYHDVWTKNTHLQKTEHGLAHIKPMPPVMVGDISVALSYSVHPSSQDLVKV